MEKTIQKFILLFFLLFVCSFFQPGNILAQCVPPTCWACRDVDPVFNVADCSCVYSTCNVGDDFCYCCNSIGCWDCECDSGDPLLTENKFLFSIDSDNSDSFTSADQTVGYVGGTSCSEMNQTFDTPITISFETSQDDGSTGNLFYHGSCCDNKPCSKNYMKCTSANCDYYFYISSLPDGYSAIKMSGCSLIGNGIFSCLHHEGDSEVYRILLKYTPPSPELCTVSGGHYYTDGSPLVSSDYDDVYVELFKSVFPFDFYQKIEDSQSYSFSVSGGFLYSLNDSIEAGSLLNRMGFLTCTTEDSSGCDLSNPLFISSSVGFSLLDEEGCNQRIDWYYSLKDTDPWWQTGEGDVVATGGDVISSIPEVCLTPGCVSAMGLFDTDESSAGVMMCKDGLSVISGAGEISMDKTDENITPNWNASADLSSLNGYTYDFFRNKAGDPDDPDTDNNNILTCPEMKNTIGLEASGYYVWEVDSGTLEIGECDFGVDKVIIFYEGNVKITGNINVNDGTGFFMIVAGGDIDIASSVVYTGSPTYEETVDPNIEGILFAQGKVQSGTAGNGADGSLYIRGMVAGIGGINMERSLVDNSAGAGQYFKFAPDLLFNYPSFLTSKNVVWREVAP